MIASEIVQYSRTVMDPAGANQFLVGLGHRAARSPGRIGAASNRPCGCLDIPQQALIPAALETASVADGCLEDLARPQCGTAC